MINTLNNLAMLVTQPGGMWANIIMAFEKGIGNYAASIIVLTLCIKLVMLPLDILNRINTRKTTRMNAIMKPELDEIQKKYGANKQILNAKTMELYKKHNYHIGSTFLIMIINLALTLTVFFTLFSGLNAMARYKTKQQYEDLQYTYIAQVYDGERTLTADEMYAKIAEIDTDEEKAKSNEAVVLEFNRVKNSFLWIDNVWASDSPFASNVLDFGGYLKISGEKKENLGEKGEEVYNTVMAPVLSTEKRANGYLVLPILAMGLIVASQFLTNITLRFKKKKKTANDDVKAKQKPNFVMIGVLAVVYGVMTMMYNSVFALYLVAGSVFTTLSAPLINMLAEHIEGIKRIKKEKSKEVSYSRKNLK